MTEIKAGLQDVVIAESTVCSIDGQKGELSYAGINIHELADHSNFEEVVFLLLQRRLPNGKELSGLTQTLNKERNVPHEIISLLKVLPRNSEPMDSLRTAVSALASFDKDLENKSLEARYQRVLKLTAQMPTLVAAIHRIRSGKDPIAPHTDYSQAKNFLYMMDGKEPEDTASKAIDIALILHADHGFNASTFAARVTASTLSDVYSAVTSAVGTLKGPLHGGANQKVMEMLLGIGKDGDPAAYVKEALAAGKKIMGFGHRVYRTEDPRATHLRKMSEAACKITGNQKWYEMSRQIELFMNQEKGINANVDFYSATVYYALGIPTDLYTLLFAMSRIAGWGAHILEQYQNNRLIRPREEYTGPRNVHWVPLSERS
jgi:citrate synthase